MRSRRNRGRTSDQTVAVLSFSLSLSLIAAAECADGPALQRMDRLILMLSLYSCAAAVSLSSLVGAHGRGRSFHQQAASIRSHQSSNSTRVRRLRPLLLSAAERIENELTMAASHKSAIVSAARTQARSLPHLLLLVACCYQRWRRLLYSSLPPSLPSSPSSSLQSFSQRWAW